MGPKLLIDSQDGTVRELSFLNFGNSFNGKVPQAYILCPKSEKPCNFIQFLNSKKFLIIAPGVDQKKPRFHKIPQRATMFFKNGVAKFFNCKFETIEEKLVECPELGCHCPVIRFNGTERNKELFHKSCKNIRFFQRASMKQYLEFVVR